MRIQIITVLLLLCSCGQTVDSTQRSEELLSTADSVIVKENETVDNSEVPKDGLTDVVEPISEEASSEEFDNVDWDSYEASQTKDFSFVILISTKDYQAALKRAKDASSKLGYPLNLRDLHPNEETGLSLPREVCEEDICGGGLTYPMYLPRSDWGEEKYVSVEYSDGFKDFTKGYYIVVVASGEKGAPVIQEALTESRKFYKDAYAKTCGVWVGCSC